MKRFVPMDPASLTVIVEELQAPDGTGPVWIIPSALLHDGATFFSLPWTTSS